LLFYQLFVKFLPCSYIWQTKPTTKLYHMVSYHKVSTNVGCLVRCGIHLQLNVNTEVICHAVKDGWNSERKGKPQGRHFKLFLVCLKPIEANGNDQLEDKTHQNKQHLRMTLIRQGGKNTHIRGILE